MKKTGFLAAGVLFASFNCLSSAHAQDLFSQTLTPDETIIGSQPDLGTNRLVLTFTGTPLPLNGATFTLTATGDINGPPDDQEYVLVYGEDGTLLGTLFDGFNYANAPITDTNSLTIPMSLLSSFSVDGSVQITIIAARGVSGVTIDSATLAYQAAELVPNFPIVVCPAPLSAQCAGTNGTPVALTVLVSDPESNALTVTWYVDGTSYQTNELAAGTTAVPVPVNFTAIFGVGSHDVLVSVTDSDTNSVTCTNIIEVADATPPAIQSLKATPDTLWPPDHTMRCVRLTLSADDPCGSVTGRVVSVTSDEPLNGQGDGNTWVDWALVPGEMKVYLRAERSGRGRGRTYTITVECADATGNTSTATVNVFVPHDQGHKVVPPPKKQNKQPKKPKAAKRWR